MGVIGNNLQRVKNILDGDYTGKSKISVGYEKDSKRHIEGDVWKEKGKTWTIKNGIKRTVNKLSQARQSINMPLLCDCGTPMKGELDKTCWRRYNKCFNCRIYEESVGMIDGSFKKEQKEQWKKGYLDFLDQTRKEYIQFLDNSSNEEFVTENGTVEEWNGGDPEIIKAQVEEDYQKMKKEIELL